MWIDGLVAQQLRGQDVGDDLLHIIAKLAVERCVGMLAFFGIAALVLGRNDDRGGRGRLAVLEAKGHLALGVGLEEGRRARAPVGGQPLEDLVAVIERGGHQLGRFVAGEAEHDPLVAGAFVLVAGRHRRLGRCPTTAGAGC